MVELTLVDKSAEAHRFWLPPDSARSFGAEVAVYADEADAPG